MKTNPIRGFLSIFSSQFSILMLNLIFTPLIVRLLGSSQYGDYAFLLSILGISMILVNAGIFDGLRKFVAESRDIPNWEDHVFGLYARVGMLFAFTGILIFTIANLTGITARLLGPRFEKYFYLLSGIIVARQVFSLIRSGLMGMGLEQISEPLKTVQRLVFGISAISLVWIGTELNGVLIGHILGPVAAIIVGFYYIYNNFSLGSVFRSPPESFPRKELLTFNSLSILLILLMSSLYHLDILLLKPLAGSQSTGYYKGALTIAEFLWFVPNILQTVLLHSTSELWSESDTSRISNLVSRITRYTLLFTLLLIMGLAALADPLLPLYYGPDFVAAVPALLLLLPGALGFAIARPIFAVGQGKGDLTLLIVATGIAATVNAVLNVILIPRYGMTGAAIATSIGYGSMLVLHGYAAYRIGYSPFSDLRLFPVGITCLVSAPVIFGSAVLLGPRPISLVIVPPLGLMVYSGVAIKVKAVDPSEIFVVTGHLPSPLSSWVKAATQAIK
ncbi:polysaccharide biosynthesis C-terminal domain-containing protein [Halosimplex sp. TS25]|uniref:oligosaccharide flippase family protein n=1 Tax=Halosimplex rarum TaxID=3396619 RepID=UPI0039ED714C